MVAQLAVCLTPDALYFRPAIFTAASLLAQDDSDGLDVMILCEERDVSPGFERLDPALRNRIRLQFVDWEKHVAGLPTRGHFTSAVNRRLALHRVLDDRHQRFVSMDADLRVGRPGLARLAALDLGGKPLAAALDMIMLKDLEDGPLTPEFRAYRQRLGLAPSTPYFNNGLTLVDRHRWDKLDVPGAARAFLAAHPDRCPFLEQSALNAVVHGEFAALSPRYNFMGDFQLLDLEEEVQPIVHHFVNRPKPWEPGWRGDQRFALAYRNWFLQSPWPEMADPIAVAGTQPVLDADSRLFRNRLLAFLARQRFIDGWTPPAG
jgi:lipopolysaccharide biosynthesis glycosyltransferase